MPPESQQSLIQGRAFDEFQLNSSQTSAVPQDFPPACVDHDAGFQGGFDMLHSKLGIAVILVCAFVSGCVTRPVYGESWAEQVKVESGACPVIDGVYQNAGERFSKAKHDTYERRTVSLAHLLNGGIHTFGSHQADDRLGQTFYDPAEDAYQTVSFQLVEDKLHIKASLADGSTRTFDLPTRQRCRDSTVLLLKADWGDIVISRGFNVFERWTIALGRAEDGSLLVRQSEASLVWLVLPIGYTGADWIRFPPVAPAPAGNAWTNRT